MVFQFGALFDSMTVKDNIGLALSKLTKMDRAAVNHRIDECCRLLDFLRDFDFKDALISKDLDSFVEGTNENLISLKSRLDKRVKEMVMKREKEASRTMFLKYDTDSSGYIDKKELRHLIVSELKTQLSKSTLNDQVILVSRIESISSLLFCIEIGRAHV